MSDNLSLRLRELLHKAQGKEVSLEYLRNELRIDPSSPAWNGLRVLMFNLVQEKIVKSSGRRDGIYRVIKQIQPVQVFGEQRERRPPFELIFPRDFHTGMELSFAESVVIREGDLITMGGVKSKGKTTLCLNICGENIDKQPILMGNEYTVLVTDENNPNKEKYDPAPRFLERLDVMKEWVNWVDEEGMDKFMLLPIRDDYAEYVVKDKINIIDWVNLDGDRSYDISKVLEGIKSNLGRGIGIVALQKGEGASNPRGGQFVRDFSDLELLLDGYGDNEDDILLTIKGAKEKKKPIVGKTFAYTIIGLGTKIINFREVKKCPKCFGRGTHGQGECDICYGKRFVDV